MSASQPDRGFIAWQPQRRTLAKVEAVQQVLADYDGHLPVTVRQIFYVLVGRQLIEKSNSEYRALGYLLRKARRARLVSFEAIHDQGSVLPHSLLGWTDADDLPGLVRAVVGNFDLDPQLAQARRLVVWCEAAGMLAQLERVCEPYGVRAISGGGFDSVSDKWGFAALVDRADELFEVLHIGDLDQHGESIFEMLAEDVQAFDAIGRIRFTRLAITEDQIGAYDLPVAPPELTGGRLVVQAEALPPDALAGLLDQAIRERLDLDQLDATRAESERIRADFEATLRAADAWGEP